MCATFVDRYFTKTNRGLIRSFPFPACSLHTYTQSWHLDKSATHKLANKWRICHSNLATMLDLLQHTSLQTNGRYRLHLGLVGNTQASKHMGDIGCHPHCLTSMKCLSIGNCLTQNAISMTSSQTNGGHILPFLSARFDAFE